MTEEKELVRSVLRGNIDAFKELIKRYEKLVAGIVFRMVSAEADREDLCQEVFISVYEKLGGFRFQSKLSTWIGNIAFNKCINFLKKKRLPIEDVFEQEEVAGDVVVDAGDHAKADQILLKKEMKRMLETVIEELPPVQRAVLQLFHYEDQSLEEISMIMSLPVNTVKSHLFRARKNLKNKMLVYIKR